MTLIYSVLTPNFVMQASDRRVSRFDSQGRPLGYLDDRNKAIFTGEHAAFAYTGHAYIGDRDTAVFFADVMSGAMRQGLSVMSALESLADECTLIFGSLPATTDRHHAFVGVGWEAGECIGYVISNALDGSHWQVEVSDRFSVSTRRLMGSDEVSVWASGVAVSTDAVARLQAQIAFQLDQSEDPEPVAHLLIGAIREEAEVDRAVGRGIMINCLPIRPGPPDGSIVLEGRMPTLSLRTFTYVAPGSFEGCFLGPLIVASDGARVNDLQITGASVTSQDSGGGVWYRPSHMPQLPKGKVGQRIKMPIPSRNDPCWCRSGLKFKKCHGN